LVPSWTPLWVSIWSVSLVDSYIVDLLCLEDCHTWGSMTAQFLLILVCMPVVQSNCDLVHLMSSSIAMALHSQKLGQTVQVQMASSSDVHIAMTSSYTKQSSVNWGTKKLSNITSSLMRNKK
jgi:hypothetical protein